MTSPVNSYSPSQALPDPVTPTNTSSLTSSPGSTAGKAASSGEAVTLTPDAQTSAALLNAARAAAGVDLQAVQSLKAQIASSAYAVPPENLAASIVTALAEIRS